MSKPRYWRLSVDERSDVLECYQQEYLKRMRLVWGMPQDTDRERERRMLAATRAPIAASKVARKLEMKFRRRYKRR